MDEIILVDEDDVVVGVGEKIDVHRKAILHRAFSVCVFNGRGEMLIQKRALGKYHCGGLLANTCCSHQRDGEVLQDAVHQRLKEEMGFDCELKEIGKFHYKKKFENGLTENEIDHVFVGEYSGEVLPNSEEVCDYKWIGMDVLRMDVLRNPEIYSVWLREILDRFDFDAIVL